MKRTASTVGAVLLVGALWSLTVFGVAASFAPSMKLRELLGATVAADVGTEVEAPSEKLDAGAPRALRADSVTREARAIDIVWRDVYRMDGSPPTVIWVEADSLDCAGGNAWIDTSAAEPAEGARCVGGLFLPDRFVVYVAWPDGTTRYSDTFLAHELVHARLFLDTGDVQYNHAGFDHAPNGRVDAANAALRKAGL